MARMMPRGRASSTTSSRGEHNICREHEGKIASDAIDKGFLLWVIR